MNPPNLITAYLLALSFGAAMMPVIILLIICPLIWSRDSGRRARSREAFRMVTSLLTGRWTK